MAHRRELSFTVTETGGVAGRLRRRRSPGQCWFGRALLTALLRRDWVRRAERGRALRVTPAGRAALRADFGIDWQ